MHVLSPSQLNIGKEVCTLFMVISVILYVKGLNYMSRGLKVSHSLIVNMVLFFNINYF